jgi:spermidine/putrescine transport system permease protein
VSGALQSSRAPLLTTYALLVYAFLYFPIVVLVVYSFNGSGVGGFPPSGWTFDWYRQLFADAALWDAVRNSFIVAAVAVAISLGLGLPAALALDRAQFPGKALFRRLVLLPLILPGIITGLSLLMLFVGVGMKLSLVTVTLGHGTALISVATTEIFAGLQKMDRAQEEASLDLGANHWKTFWRITFPNLQVSLIAAALLIFTLSLDEIAVTFFLIGRDNTLPLEIWSRLRRGITPEINAISTLILLFSISTILIWYPASHAHPTHRRISRGGSHTAFLSRRRTFMSDSRRDFLKFIVVGSMAAGCPADLSLFSAQDSPVPHLDGDHYEICHQVRDGHTFAKPPVSKRHEVVIVGGGVSGLSAAYFLQTHDFLLLEKEAHWGGNATLRGL